MDQFSISIEWIVLHKQKFPWLRVLGASLISEEGRKAAIAGIEMRPWPSGPLVELKYLDQPNIRPMWYNLQGLEARFILLSPVGDQANAIEEFYIHTEEESVRAIALAKDREARALLEEQQKIDEQAKKEERARQERKKRIEEENRLQAVKRQKNLEELNFLRKFDLLLFDLDDTLLKTSHLESYRGVKNSGNNDPEYLNALRQEVKKLTHLIGEVLISELQHSFKDLKLAVITKSPRNYARILLKESFPNIKWDALVAYEEVDGKVKPSPEGINRAADFFGIQDFSRIAFVGNDENDIRAAYRAGIYAILFQGGWSLDWNEKSHPERPDHWRSLALSPDAVIEKNQLGQLLKLIIAPWSTLPTLESWGSAWGAKDAAYSSRVDSRRYFFSAEEVNSDADDGIWIKMLGRYFKTKDGFSEPRSRGHSHQLTQVILDAKSNHYYPEWVVDCCVFHIIEIAKRYASYNKKLIPALFLRGQTLIIV